MNKPNREHGRAELPPHWRMEQDDVTPSWAEHCVKELPYTSVMEIGAALNSEYPHFHAVLTPERTFLHYIIAELICTVSMRDPKAKDGEPALQGKEFLAAQVDRLMKLHAEHVKTTFPAKRAAKQSDIDHVARMAADFYDHKQDNPKYKIPGRDVAVDALIRDIKLFGQQKGSKGKKASIKENDDIREDLRVEYQKLFDGVYDRIEASVGKGYTRGKIDRQGLKKLKDIFVAAVVSEWQQKELYMDGDIKKYAHDIIEAEVQAGNLKALPVHPKDQTSNIVISGNIASGKTVLLSKLEADGAVDRSKCAVIDIDEFRDLEQIVVKPKTGEEGKNWSMRAQEECHQIRRKILDILQERDKTPDVVLMTAFLSKRVRHWLVEGGPQTKVYVLHCSPERALKNAYDRAKETGRWVTSERVLESIRNIGATLHYIFSMDGKAGNLSLEVIDTTDAKITTGPDGKPLMENHKTIVLANPMDHMQIYDADIFRDIYKSFFMKQHMDAPHPNRLYQGGKLSDKLVNENLPILFEGHKITFHGKGGVKAVKPLEAEVLTGSEIRSVLASSATLNYIFGTGPAPVGMSKDFKNGRKVE